MLYGLPCLLTGETKVALVLAMRACEGSRSIAPLLFNLGARWRLVGNVTPRPLYPRQRPPLGGLTIWGRKKSPPPARIQIPDRPYVQCVNFTKLYSWMETRLGHEASTFVPRRES
jgi:hypothetical protein